MAFLQRIVSISTVLLILNPNQTDCKEIRFIETELNGGYKFQTLIKNKKPHVFQKAIQIASGVKKEYNIPIDCYLPFISQRGGCLSSNPDRLGGPAAPKPHPTVPRIAVLLPLSGKHSKIGQAMLNASQLALFHFADKQFELLPHDTLGTERGALDAITLAIGDGASLILGPLFSRSVKAVAPAARAAGIRVIAFSNDRRVAGDGVFTMGFLPEEQVRRVTSFAILRGIRRFGVLAPNNEYGLKIADTLKETVERFGGELVVNAVYNYQAPDADLHPVIKRLANYDERRQNLLEKRQILVERDDEAARLALKRIENLQTIGDVSFEALLIAEGGKKLETIAALLPYYDIDPKKIRVLGTGHWDVAGLGSEPALRGGWFAAPDPSGRLEFIRQYREIFGQIPPRLSTLAYDATALAAIFAHKFENSSGGDARIKYKTSDLVTPNGFKGLDGIFRFVTEGYVERGLSVFQVGERRSKILSLAPEVFEEEISN